MPLGVLCWPYNDRFVRCLDHLIHLNYPSTQENSYINGLVQDCNISSALVMEKLQFYIKPSIWSLYKINTNDVYME